MTESEDVTGEATSSGDGAVDEVLRLLAAAPPVSPSLAPGTEIAGRYVVERRLGRGGMGVVYSAYDRELERRVALKLHRTAADPRAAARMLREARAMARLAHPNVLTVHEVGEHAGQIFIVVEWVDGADLRAWLAERPRTPTEILAVFVAAGEGLAAAHDAGLVHRDVKPANVLIAVDGRVRVADFGLARAAETGGAPATSPVMTGGAAAFEARGAPRRPAATSPATTSGEVEVEARAAVNAPAATSREFAGTPGYMSPEQARGAAVDARSDQYGFCVALWEALHGAPPRVGASPSPRLPAGVGAALLRGLSEAPGERFADMRGLLAALRPERALRRRRRWIAGGALIGVAAASAAFGVSVAPPAVSCAAEAWQVAAILPDERREALARVFAATGGPYAAEAWPRVERALRGYADELAAGASAACSDTHVHGVQSAALLDLRMRCLGRARREFSARLTALSAVDRATLARAVALASSLPELARCADGEALAGARDVGFAVGQPGAGEATGSSGGREEAGEATGRSGGREAGAVGERLAAGRAALISGDARGARELAEALAVEVDARGDPRWIAEQRELAGKALLAAHDTAGARARLEEGYLAARTAGDEARAARLSLALAGLQTTRAAEHRDALLWTRISAGELARGGGDREAAVDLLLVEGNAHVGLGELATALARYQAAEDALAAAGSPRPDHLGAVLSHRGVALELMGRFAEATAAQERGLEIFRASLGAHHPICVGQLTLIGTALAGAGRLDEAEARYREAIALGEAIHGGDHPALAVTLADLAVLEGTRGRLAAAIALLERVLRIHEAAPEADPEAVAATLAMLGEYHSVAGDPRTGLGLLDRALARERATFGDEHARVAECRMRRAQVLADTGDLKQALAEQLVAAAGLERTLGPDSPVLADSLMIAGDNSRALGEVGEGEALLRRSLAIWGRIDRDNPQAMHAATSLGALLVVSGRAAEAVPLLTRAVEIREAEAAAPWRLAESRYQLARALWAVGDERPRALRLATQARDALAREPDPLTPGRVVEVEAWLHERRAR